MLRVIIVCIFGWLLLWSPSGVLAREAGKVTTISALEAQEMLSDTTKPAFLIDVRTRAEYTLLGHPPKAYNVPWRFATTDFQVAGGPYGGGKARFTGYQLSPKPNPDFLSVVRSLFKPADRLIILSTTGELGAEAARALARAGFKQVFNIRHGFLGDPLRNHEQDKLAEKFSPYYGRRGRVNGWVFWGLPVTYRIDPRYVYPPDIKRMQTLK
jgi:rhodanese-related sulfurtransferase